MKTSPLSPTGGSHTCLLFQALIDIKTGSIMGGKLPPKARALTEEWRLLNQDQILKCWNLIRESGQYFKIRGLDD